MFVTQTQFEQFVPAPVSKPNSRYWRAVALSLPTPWYLCICRTNGDVSSRTILVAWEADLLELVTAKNHQIVSAVARLDMAAAQSMRWQMRWVESMWRSASDEQDEVGPLVFLFEEEEGPRDDLLRALPRRSDRVRVFSSSDTSE